MTRGIFSDISAGDGGQTFRAGSHFVLRTWTA
jgi:hypothetical protein